MILLTGEPLTGKVPVKLIKKKLRRNHEKESSIANEFCRANICLAIKSSQTSRG